jgi:hypothetical protein
LRPSIHASVTLALALAACAWCATPPPAHAAAETVATSFTLHGFADAQLGLSNARPDAGGDVKDASFVLGQFDLYMVARLSERFSFLGETVFESGQNGETVVDLERVFLKYSWSDAFHASAGRTHTPIGYWNTAYHHGALLQPTIDRPEALRFEDDGGLLPVHAVGLELSGHLPAGPGHFDYVANVANGRGPIADMVQTGADLNLHKATALQLAYTREGEVLATVGASGYADNIPPAADAPAGTGETRERIGGVHAHVHAPAAEFIAEGFTIEHESTAGSFRHRAAYAVLVVGGGPLRPYGAVDGTDVNVNDPFYAPSPGDRTTATLGVRFDANPATALKFELRSTRMEGGRADGAFVQAAYTF